MVLDKAQLNALVAAGVRNGVWEYHDATRGDDGWATKERPDAAFRLGEDTFLYPVGSAPEPTPKPCPFCGQVHPPGPCPDDNGTKRKAKVGVEFEATGSAGVAFAEAKGKATGGRAAEARRAPDPSRRARIGRADPAREAAQRRARDAGRCRDPLRRRSERRARRAGGQPERHLPRHAAEVPAAPGGRAAGGRRSGSSVCARLLTATFETPLELAGQEVADLQQRATDTGPDKCTVTIVTEDAEWRGVSATAVSIARNGDGRIVSLTVDATDLEGGERHVTVRGARVPDLVSPLQQVLRERKVSGRAWTSPRADRARPGRRRAGRAPPARGPAAPPQRPGAGGRGRDRDDEPRGGELLAREGAATAADCARCASCSQERDGDAALIEQWFPAATVGAESLRDAERREEATGQFSTSGGRGGR